MIEIQAVGKRFGQRWAVQDLTFAVRQGEVLGFLGPNGAGKTTTMRILTGYMPPTTGSVRVDGVDALEEPVRLKTRIGYLPEAPPIYGEMTVAGYLRFVAEIRRVNARRRRAHVDEVMGKVGVSDVAGRLAGRLSRGYRQRVGLAAALVGDPPVLVLDEPTSGMDPQQIIEMRSLIRSLAGRHTVILSSHILPEVQSTCERVLVINQGRLVAQGTPQDLAARVQGGRHLVLVVKGTPDRLEQAVAGLDGVQSVRISPDGAPAGDRARAELDLADPAPGQPDVRERLFYAMARHDLPILEMRAVDLSLEDVFLRLVRHDPDLPAAPDGEHDTGGGASWPSSTSSSAS